jgi:hypothetical protein
MHNVALLLVPSSSAGKKSLGERHKRSKLERIKRTEKRIFMLYCMQKGNTKCGEGLTNVLLLSKKVV